jgi:hypothetical protein
MRMLVAATLPTRSTSALSLGSKTAARAVKF